MKIKDVNEFKETLKLMVPTDYSLGIHGITGNNDYEEIARLIVKDGLKFSGWGGVLSSVAMYPQLKDISDDALNKIFNYSYSINDNEQCVNVLVALPNKFNDAFGNEYFLGHYNECNEGYAKGVDKAGGNLPITKFTEKIRTLPKEFIVGYNVGRANSREFTFIPNPDFIGLKKEEDKQVFFETLLAQGLKDCAYTTTEAEMMINHPLFEKFKNGENEYWKQYQEYLKSKKENHNK